MKPPYQPNPRSHQPGYEHSAGVTPMTPQDRGQQEDTLKRDLKLLYWLLVALVMGGVGSLALASHLIGKL